MAAALAIVAFLFLLSGALVVAGIHLLFGLPVALIATGLMLFGAALALRLGLKPNG